MIVEQTQVGLQAQPHPAGRFRVICGDEVVILILKKRFPILSFRRSRVCTQDGSVHGTPLLNSLVLPETGLLIGDREDWSG